MVDLYQQLFFTTLAIGFATLHLILFFYNRHLKSNLYFAIFAFLYSANIFFDFQAALSDRTHALFFLRIHRAVMPYNPIFALLFLYSLLESRIPRQFWLICLGLIVTGALAVIEPIDNFNYVQFFLIAVLIEAIRIIRLAIKQKKDGVWIIAGGFAFLFIFSAYDMLMDFGVISPVGDIVNGYPFGFVGLIFSMSVFLARDFARTNERILAKERIARDLEMQQGLLAAEDARKTAELQEARKLQLSMLPQNTHEIRGLDVCFDMHPATEVGGDYYDYLVSEDGSLTIAIGDATGHGMKAGIMVAIIKSLFTALADKADALTFFEKASRTIKQMALGNLYMALMIVKVKDRKLQVSSAGMPPFYIYRAFEDSIEDFVVKGMPLGAFDSFSYKTIATELSIGDTLLFMSDGLPELFNDEKEILEYSRIKEAFREVAGESPRQIVRHLLTLGDKWRGTRKQEDDITLLVLKVKQ